MISADFKKAVELRDEEKVKMMLKNSLTMDLTFNQFKSMLAHAVGFIPYIIEPHDGTIFEPKENWNKDYASLLKYDLVDNFSAERIEHIKEVQLYVYTDEIKKQQENSNDDINSPSDKSSEFSFDTQRIITLVMALGVATASIIIGVVSDLSIVNVATTAIIATIIIGGITYYIVKK